jgi:cysteine synthase A
MDVFDWSIDESDESSLNPCLPVDAHRSGTGSAPVRLLRLPLQGRTLRLRLHLEGTNRYGSVKDRTARALLGSLESTGALTAGGHVIESTSGNMGIALAGMCAERGYRCTLVVDDVTCAFSLNRMAELGAELIRVPTGNAAHAVSARIETVHRFREAHPHTVWTDQYDNPAGPAVHARTTGPALLGGYGPEYGHGPAPGGRPHPLPPPDAVAVPVSTGGTLAGTARYLRAHSPEVGIWAVDAVGSAATGGTAAIRPDKLPGFGSGVKSHFLTPADVDRTVRVSDAEAATTCRIVRQRTGIALGGSAGATVLAACREAHEQPWITDVACLCPDGGDRYEETIYAPGMSVTTAADLGHGVLDGLTAALEDV